MKISAPNRWLLQCIRWVFTALILQFCLFRLPPVYDLNLKTHLYDHVWWVDQPAKHLILGSSNAMNAIMPERIANDHQRPISDFLNLGMNGATPFFMYRNLKLYLDKFSQHPRPERIDVVLTPIMFQEALMGKINYEKIWLSFSQWQQLQRDENITNSYFFPAMLFWESLEFDPKHNFLKYHFDLQQTRQNRGFQPNYEKPYTGDIRKRDTPNLNGSLSWSERQILYLKAIQEICQSNDIELYFVLTPLYSKLHQHYQNHPAWFEGLEKRLLAHLGPVKFIGSTSPTDFGLDHRHFINPDHLSISGARIFTEKVYADLEQHSQIPNSSFDLLHEKTWPIKP